MIMKKVLLFLLTGILLNSATLSEIPNLEKVSNYGEIKGIEVGKIVYIWNVVKEKDGVVYNLDDNTVFNGVRVYRNEKNAVKGLEFYKYGKKNGTHYTYYDNGKIYTIENFLDNKIIGKSHEYYPNGVTKKTADYNTGVVTRFDKNGRKTFSQEIKNNRIMLREHFEKGVLEKKYVVKDVKNNFGILTSYYSNGNTSISQEVVLKKNASNEIIYENHGESKYYDKNGKLFSVYYFKNGLLDPEKVNKIYYENGKLKMSFKAEKNDYNTLKNFVYKDEVKKYYENGGEKVTCKENPTKDWNCSYFSDDGNVYKYDNIKSSEVESIGERRRR